MNIKILEFSKTVLVRFLPVYLIMLKKLRKNRNTIFGQYDRRKVNQLVYHLCCLVLNF